MQIMKLGKRSEVQQRSVWHLYVITEVAQNEVLYSLIYPKHQEQHRAHSRCSIHLDINGFVA